MKKGHLTHESQVSTTEILLTIWHLAATRKSVFEISSWTPVIYFLALEATLEKRLSPNVSDGIMSRRKPRRGAMFDCWRSRCSRNPSSHRRFLRTTQHVMFASTRKAKRFHEWHVSLLDCACQQHSAPFAQVDGHVMGNWRITESELRLVVGATHVAPALPKNPLVPHQLAEDQITKNSCYTEPLAMISRVFLYL